MNKKYGNGNLRGLESKEGCCISLAHLFFYLLRSVISMQRQKVSPLVDTFLSFKILIADHSICRLDKREKMEVLARNNKKHTEVGVELYAGI